MANQGGDELDYDIHFPPPSDTVEPVVILLGWAGCQEKHLAKYSAIYEQRCITIQYTAPTEDIFYSSENLKLFALKILEVITDLNLEDNPILFHVFSNGGGLIYRFISEAAGCDSGLNIIGCIFDSLPAQRNAFSSARALMAASNSNIVIKYFMAFFLVMYIYSRDLVQKMWRGSQSPVSYWQFMYTEPPKWPALYLYSKADAIVDYRYVEEVIANRRRLGADVASVCWEDSAHVAHLRKHTEAYINQCQQFLDYCLSKSDTVQES